MSLQRTALTSPAVTSYNSLANSLTSVASSAAVTVGSSTNVVDHEIVVTINGPATMTGSATTVVNLFLYTSIDGTLWSGSGTTNELIDGTDKAITLSSNGNNGIPLGSVAITTTSSGSSISYKSKVISIAAACGGTLPSKYVIVAQNQSSAALASSGHSITVSEIYYS